MLIRDRATLARRYLKSWFVPDLISSVPYRLLLRGGGSSLLAQSKKGLKMFRLLRLGKLIRLLRMSKLMRKLRGPLQQLADVVRVDFEAYYELFKGLVGFMTLVHWTGASHASPSSLIGRTL